MGWFEIRQRPFTKSTLLNQDLLHLNNNERSIFEIAQMVRIVEDKTKEYFDYDNLQKKRKPISTIN